MSNIKELLKEIEIHDSSLDSLLMKGDGSMELKLDIDEVWNKELDENIRGVVLKSVYEISEFKIDRLNTIGSVEIEEIEGYNLDFVTHNNSELGAVVMLSIEFVAGGTLDIVCSGEAEYLRCVS